MPTLKDLADKVGRGFKDRTRIQYRASIFVKIAFVTLGASASAGGLAVDVAAASGKWSFWTAIGLAGALLMAIGGIFVVITEKDVSKELETAREAIEKAREFEQEKHDFEENISWLNHEVRRGLDLYYSMSVMRNFIEKSLGRPDVTLGSIMQDCLTGAQSSLHVAFDFAVGDTWTICIYEAQNDKESGKVVLRCVAHDRTIHCPIEQARAWQEGHGVAGTAYSNARQIIVPDMYAPELGTTFALEENARPQDRERYHSIAAVPVMIGSGKIPWGVVVASSNRAGHFDDQPVDGVATAEPVRAIAGMVALAVKALASPPRVPVVYEGVTAPASPTSTPSNDGHTEAKNETKT